MTIWRNKVEFRHLFTDESVDEDVLVICDKLIPQLERIYKKEINR